MYIVQNQTAEIDMQKSMGYIIRELRIQKGLTQEELAQRLNLTPQAISKWERGIGMPDISHILPLSDIFEVSTDILFGNAKLH